MLKVGDIRDVDSAIDTVLMREITSAHSKKLRFEADLSILCPKGMLTSTQTPALSASSQELAV